MRFSAVRTWEAVTGESDCITNKFALKKGSRKPRCFQSSLINPNITALPICKIIKL